MHVVRPWSLMLAVVSLSFVLASCGSSNSGNHVTAQPPVFTSTPPAAAAQGSAYSYQVAATDPSGGTVSYALTTGPTGASMTGSSVAWTPTAAQSRASNSFTVKATTSEGASATQSWNVSPTGTVTVNDVFTYWTPSGQEQFPAPTIASLEVSAVVPQSDGSLLVLKGSTTSPGVISIPGVPAGNYWLTFSYINQLIPTISASYWTNTSTFDAGRDVAGSPPTLLSSASVTNFDFTLSGLASLPSPTEVLFNTDIQVLSPALIDPSNSTSLSVMLGYDTNIDWSKVSQGFLLQYEPNSLGSLQTLVLGPSASLNLSLTNGATNSITQALQSTSPASLGVTVQGTQWAPLFTGASPAAATTNYSGFSLVTEPYVTGASAVLSASDINLVGTAPPLHLLLPFGDCDSGFPILSLATQPGILDDENLGALQYSDPFDPSWTRRETFCEQAMIPVPLSGTSQTASFALTNGVSAAPSGSPIVPIVSPVQNPAIGSGSLFTATTLNTTMPSLTWSAPTLGSPYGYRVTAYVQTTLNNNPAYQIAGYFYTSQTSLTLPPLSGGNVYVFSITALVDGAANVQTSPFRSALPTGYASVVSAPMTISPGATKAAIHGDARVIRRLSQPGKAGLQTSDLGRRTADL